MHLVFHAGCIGLDTVKSWIKAAAYALYFNCVVRFLFKCGFYLRVAFMQCCESTKTSAVCLAQFSIPDSWCFVVNFELYEKSVRSCAALRAMLHVETTKPCACSTIVGLFTSEPCAKLSAR